MCRSRMTAFTYGTTKESKVKVLNRKKRYFLCHKTYVESSYIHLVVIHSALGFVSIQIFFVFRAYTFKILTMKTLNA